MLKKKDLISRMAFPPPENSRELQTDVIFSINESEAEAANSAKIGAAVVQNEKAVPMHNSDGKPTGFRLEESDREIFRQKIRELDLCGLNPSKNLIARAALRLLPRDHRLVETVRELMAAD